MNEEDTSLYGKNREGKVALCETLLNTLLRKIAVEPVPKEVQWWEAQERFENLIGAEFCRGGGCPSRSSITSVTLQRSMPTPAQMS